MKLVSFLFALACSVGCSEVKNAYDCAHICDRYQECFDDSYDTDSCTSACKDMANNDDNFADQASSCQ